MLLEPLLLLAILNVLFGIDQSQQTLVLAITYRTSEAIPTTSMVRSGVVFDIVGAVLYVFGAAVMALFIGLA